MQLLGNTKLSRRRSRLGVTFIEVMVASLILVVGLMGLTSAWIFNMQMTRKTDETAVSYNIARSTVDLYRAKGFQFVATGTTDTYYDAAGLQYTGTSPSDPYYHAITIIRDVGQSTPILNQKEVRVTVYRVSNNEALFATRSFLSLGGL